MSFELPFPSEKFIEDYVCHCLEQSEYCPVSSNNYDFHLRQHEIKGYGITDVIKFSFIGDDIYITILELKNEPLKEAHLGQLARYMAGAKRLARRYCRRFKNKRVFIDGELAGPLDSSKNSFVYLIPLLETNSITAYSLNFSMEEGFTANPINAGWFNGSEDKKLDRDILQNIISGSEFARLEMEEADKIRQLEVIK